MLTTFGGIFMRKLGVVELYIRGEHPADAPKLGCHFKIDMDADRPITVECLRKTINVLQKCYPPLRYRIAETGAGVFLVDDCVAEIPLQVRMDQISDEERFVQITKEEALAPMSEDGPLLKFVYFPNSGDLIFTFHHIIADGMSGVNFMKHFFQTLSEIQQGVQPSIGIILELPAIENLVPALPAEISPPPQTSPGSNTDCSFPIRAMSSNELTTDFIYHAFTLEDTQNILTNCHKQQVTVNDALTTVGLLAFYDELKNVQPQLETIKVVCLINVDTRERLPLPVSADRVMGNFASRISIPYIMKGDEDFRVFAGKIHDDAQAGIQKRDYLRYLCQKPSGPVPTFCISNIGNVKIPTDYPHFRLTGVTDIMTSTQSLRRTNASWYMAVHSFNGRLVISLPFSVPIMTRERAEYMMRRILHHINANILSHAFVLQPTSIVSVVPTTQIGAVFFPPVSRADFLQSHTVAATSSAISNTNCSVTVSPTMST